MKFFYGSYEGFFLSIVLMGLLFTQCFSFQQSMMAGKFDTVSKDIQVNRFNNNHTNNIKIAEHNFMPSIDFHLFNFEKVKSFNSDLV